MPDDSDDFDNMVVVSFAGPAMDAAVHLLVAVADVELVKVPT